MSIQLHLRCAIVVNRRGRAPGDSVRQPTRPVAKPGQIQRPFHAAKLYGRLQYRLGFLAAWLDKKPVLGNWVTYAQGDEIGDPSLTEMKQNTRTSSPEALKVYRLDVLLNKATIGQSSGS